MTEHDWLNGDWIQTFTGRQFWPLSPRPDDIDIRDIAHALSLQCRYAGHCSRFYSVAEHSVYVSRAVFEEHALAALLHDASEAYLVDVPRPIKSHLGGYKEAEAALEHVIALTYGVEHPWHSSIKDADTRILMDEKAALMGPSPVAWSIDVKPLGIAIEGWDPLRAEREFLGRFTELAR